MVYNGSRVSFFCFAFRLCLSSVLSIFGFLFISGHSFYANCSCIDSVFCKRYILYTYGYRSVIASLPFARDFCVPQFFAAKVDVLLGYGLASYPNNNSM